MTWPVLLDSFPRPVHRSSTFRTIIVTSSLAEVVNTLSHQLEEDALSHDFNSVSPVK